MKHKLLPTMIGAVLAGGMAAAQADITVFGHIDTSIVSHDADKGFVEIGKMPSKWSSNIAGQNLSDNIDDTNLTCTTCSIGFKGSEDLGNGLKAIFKIDFQYNMFSRNNGSPDSIIDRDQWLGLAGNFGQVRYGTISTPYKSHGAMIDPLYRTAAQGRDHGLQSFLHANAGEDGQGRAEHTIRWDSPDWNGFKLAAYYTMDSSERDGVDNVNPPITTPNPLNPGLKEDDDAYGIGAQYSNGGILVFADYITNDSDDVKNANGDLTAWKAGGKYTINNFAVMGQYEHIEAGIANPVISNGKGEGSVWTVAGSYTMGNNMLYLGYGSQEAQDLTNNAFPDDDVEATALTIAGVHKLSKRTSIYAAYNTRDQDNDTSINGISTIAIAGGQGGIVNDPEKDVFAVGMKHKF